MLIGGVLMCKFLFCFVVNGREINCVIVCIMIEMFEG